MALLGCATPPNTLPERVRLNISMDFIKSLPKVTGKELIFVVVDRLNKATHFMVLKYPYTVLDMAQVFINNIFRLHEMSKINIFDRDVVFTSKFWQELFNLQKVSLLTSTTYHPQTDGQSEIVNRCLECYLRCMTFEKPK